MNFELTTLGTASALPSVERYPSAHVFNMHGRFFLIDCGEACQMQLRRYRISFAKIDNILISHLHGDHLFGLFGLLSTMMMQGRTAPLHIYAPTGFGPILNFFKMNFGDGLQYEIEWHHLKSDSPELLMETRNYTVTAFPLNHKIACYGFLFREKTPQYNVEKWRIEADNLTLHEIAELKNGRDVVRENGDLLSFEKYAYLPYQPRSFAYCSDTAPFEHLEEWLCGVDLLYHEATFASDLEESASKYFHSTAAQAAALAKKIGAKKLVIGHFSSRYPNLETILKEAQNIFPDTFLAKEGMTFDIPALRKK